MAVPVRSTPRRSWWRATWAAGLVLAVLVPAVVLIFQVVAHKVDDLQACNDRQGSTLVAHGLPADGAAGKPGTDGQGGWCLATDPDGDGVYMCPDVA